MDNVNNNDNKMYAIVIGEYSDWDLLGYIIGTKNAIDYCASYNYSLDEDGNVQEREYHPAYYVPLHELTSDTTNTPNFLYEYTVHFKQVDNEYIPFHYEGDRYIVSITPTLPTSTLQDEFNFSSANSTKYVNVTFARASYISKERAIKIAQDKLSQHLYYKAMGEKVWGENK